MTPADITQLVRLCRDRAGLEISPDKSYLIETRLTAVARREGFTSAADLMAAIRAGREDRLGWAAIEAMTVSQTTFFRDRAAFALLGESLLPYLAGRRGHEPIRLWSAGCATGAEAYSMAMTVADSALSAETRVEIVGSDISERALEKARSGLFTQFEVQRGLPVRKLLAHFIKHEDSWAVSPRLRTAVQWKRENLIGDLRQSGPFDVIFCRHVLSMLDGAIRRRVIDAMVTALTPDGCLVLGPGEGGEDVGQGLRSAPQVPELYCRDPSVFMAA
jgi:chemotaxis protein methyltransferase CheR